MNTKKQVQINVEKDVRIVKEVETITLDLPLYRKSNRNMGEINYLHIDENERVFTLETTLNSVNIDLDHLHHNSNPLDGFPNECSAIEFDAVMHDWCNRLTTGKTPATMLAEVNVDKALVASIMGDFFTEHHKTCHGIAHWLRVMKNGLTIARHKPDVDPTVIVWFSLFHDSKRTHDEQCDVHSGEGAKNAMAHKDLLNLNEKQLMQLEAACSGHTAGLFDNDPTVAACWDADRLDLYRVGIVTSAKYLNSDEAKNLIGWGIERAGNDHWEADLANILNLEQPKEI